MSDNVGWGNQGVRKGSQAVDLPISNLARREGLYRLLSHQFSCSGVLEDHSPVMFHGSWWGGNPVDGFSILAKSMSCVLA